MVDTLSDSSTMAMVSAAIREYNQGRYGNPDLFTSIAIETTSWCNRACAYCPVSLKKREYFELDTKVVESVLDQLGVLNFTGTIYFHLFNEPLRDPRLLSLVSYARARCPESRLFASSNGDYLAVPLLQGLIEAGLDTLYVTQYNAAVASHVQEALEFCRARKSTVLQVRVQNVFDNNRGGSIQKLSLSAPLRESCSRVNRMMAINCMGDVVICCNDYFGEEVLGNVSKSSLLDIWQNERFREIRSLLRQTRRSEIPICAKCNESANVAFSIADLQKTSVYKHLSSITSEHAQ